MRCSRTEEHRGLQVATPMLRSIALSALLLPTMSRLLVAFTTLIGSLLSMLLPGGTPALAQARPELPADNLSVYVQELDTGKVVLALNEHTPRSPASTIKVLTTFAALDMLGPAYTWKTRAYLDGTLSRSQLQGNLILVGGGDPYLTSERWWRFVQNLRELGLERISGDVVIDNSYFAATPGGRGDFDNQPFRSYNVFPDALMVNFQTSRFTVQAQGPGGRPQVLVHPMPANLQVRNQLRLGNGRCQGYNRGVSFSTPDTDANTVVVSGVFPAACGSFSLARAIMNAPDYAFGTFQTLWEQSGGQLEGTQRLATLPPQARLFHEYESVPLTEVIRLVNKYSNNVMARHLLLTLAARQGALPATADAGRQAIQSWLTQRNVQIPGLVIDNGSGLSRAERLTAQGLGEVLNLAWDSPFMPEFAASLPLSAIDGTLRNRFKDEAMQGRLRLKTGHLDDVSALAGFVTAASGKRYVAVIFVNHPGAQSGSGQAIQAQLIRWIFEQ